MTRREDPGHKLHRDLYPEQYTHALVGQRVQYGAQAHEVGTVERVVASRFGPLVIIAELGARVSFAVAQCRPVHDLDACDMFDCPECYPARGGQS